jgi:alkaline phosphatase D
MKTSFESRHARRRRLLLGTAGAAAAAGLSAIPFVRHARAADTARFALGVASGQPQPEGMVLWTLLTGAGLPPSADVRWEVAEDEAFKTIAARGTETALAEDQHSVHAEPRGLRPDRWYWYRFNALGAQSRTGRTRTAPAAGTAVAQLRLAIASCQRWDVGHHAAEDKLDLILFLGDYIYEYASSSQSLRPNQGGLVRTLADYRQRHAQYKSDPHLQDAHAAAPWLLVWDDHEVDNDYAGITGQALQPDFATQRGAAYRAYWEYMPLPKSLKPTNLAGGGQMRMFGSTDWGSLARIHLLDDRQYRAVQACPRPGRAGSNTLPARDCPAFADPQRSLLGREQESWLAGNWALDTPWNLLAQQTLMARFSWTDPSRAGGGTYWTDGWDGYAPARKRLLATVAERKVPGVLVLGGDVHTHYVADLKVDFDDEKAAPVATEFCGSSIASPSLDQSRIDAARAFNPHVHYANGEKRGYVRLDVSPRETRATLRTVNDATDVTSGIRDAAVFAVDAARAGARKV